MRAVAELELYLVRLARRFALRLGRPSIGGQVV